MAWPEQLEEIDGSRSNMSLILIKLQQTGTTSGERQSDFLILKSHHIMKYLILSV